MLRLRDGNRQVQEYTDEQVFTTVYEQDSFVPVARIVQLASHLEQKRLADIAYETRRFVRIGESDVVINQRIADKSQPIIKIYHYHCNHLGTPQELSDDKGDIIWLSYDRAWGGNFDTLYKQQFVDNFAVSENELQPFKFQGQTLDTETGLHYNRFRYYDSDVGMFVQRDPIELEGGLNTFAYTPNPVNWIDPSGLNCKIVNPKVNMEHIFHGEINKSGKAVGFHHEGTIGHINKARIVQITALPNSRGIYRAKVEIFNSKTNTWVAKNAPSTFFPKLWSKLRVVNEVKEAYCNGTVLPNGKFSGISNGGVKIEGWVTPTGNINTAYPIY